MADTTFAKLVSNITNDKETQSLLEKNGLRAHKVTWEDTGRDKNSCWGPNISDMTLLVKEGDQLMPVIRKPNFSDTTDDVPIDAFKILVGNEYSGVKVLQGKKVISLKEYLQNIQTYTSNSHKIDLLHERDSVILTSSQCCVLPVQRKKSTQFCLQLFNYQSFDDDPAVLVILVTKDGTSTQVVGKSNQKLFFNDRGDARWFKVKRLQDYREEKTGQKQEKVQSFKEMKDEEKIENCIMMIQVPLKVKPRPQRKYFDISNGNLECFYDKGTVRDSSNQRRIKGEGMDMGMIGLGSKEGEFTGTQNLRLERDDRFPIRCTFQYYRVTDQNYIDNHDIFDIAEQLAQAGKKAVASGSLVVDRDSERVTEPVLDQPKPSDNPLTKLEERDYLLKCREESDSLWKGEESMASFILPNYG